MKNTYFCILAAIALPCTFSCKKSDTHSESALQRVEVAKPLVDSVVIHKSYPGQLIANREVNLVARVDGYLTAKTYTSGDLVHKGDVLFKIEEHNYIDAVQKAEADLSQAQANLEYASTRYSAMVEALKGDAVSEMEVAQAKSTLEECKAAVKTARTSLQSAQTQLSYCTVRAPFDGHITTVVHDVGSYVAGSASPVTLATIYEDNSMVVKFAIEDNESLGNLKHNIAAGKIDFAHIPLSIPEHLEHQYTCSLDYLSPAISTSTGTLALQAVTDNPYHELRSGMYVTVELPVTDEPHAVLISDAAIGSDQLGSYIYLVNDSDRVVYTTIETGQLVDDSLRIVTKGINPDDRYVTKALLKVRDGMKVEPVSK